MTRHFKKHQRIKAVPHEWQRDVWHHNEVMPTGVGFRTQKYFKAPPR